MNSNFLTLLILASDDNSTPIVSRSKGKWYKPKKVKKFAFNSQIKPDQLLTNNVQMLILCVSCFTTTVCIRDYC